MKKLLVIGVVSMFVLASCKKEYVCTCTTSGGGSTASASSTITATKKDAEAACNSTVTSGDYTTTCAIE